MTSTAPKKPAPPSPPAPETRSVGVVGARGHAGAELLRLIGGHPRLSLAFAASRTLAGRPLREVAPDTTLEGSFIEAAPYVAAAHHADVFVLALPNDVSPAYVRALDDAAADVIIVDLSADHRFDASWTYGLPETNAAAIAGARRIANPGCYATAMMLALSPLGDRLEATPHCFGVSGFSGAGTTPSPRNDPDVLRDNLLPYQLTGHLHEREVTRHLGRPVRFAPHVAPFFRGISLTAAARLTEPTDAAALRGRYETFYADSPLVHVSAEAPRVRDAAGHVHASVGGFAVSAADGRDVALVATLDNLLKGAAAQAIQNINLACGLDPQEGLRP